MCMPRHVIYVYNIYIHIIYAHCILYIIIYIYIMYLQLDITSREHGAPTAPRQLPCQRTLAALDSGGTTKLCSRLLQSS